MDLRKYLLVLICISPGITNVPFHVLNWPFNVSSLENHQIQCPVCNFFFLLSFMNSQSMGILTPYQMFMIFKYILPFFGLPFYSVESILMHEILAVFMNFN